MTLSTRFRLDRTLRANRSSTTFNAPGTYPVPYGRGLIKVGGRGPSGNTTVPSTVANYNSPTPGNIANYNPPVAGNVSGYNTASGGNVAYYNPRVPGNSTTTPGNLVPASYTPGNNNPGTYSPGNTNNPYYTEAWVGYTQSCPSGWTLSGYDYDEFGKPIKLCTLYEAGYNNPATFTPGNTNPGTYTPAYYNPSYTTTNSPTPGNANYNPYYPSTANYNPTTPGTANYNPSTPGTANYNPTVPGNAAPPMVFGGVTFPGGAADQLAPVVSPTPSNLSYSAPGVSVTVPPGAYVTITPI